MRHPFAGLVASALPLVFPLSATAQVHPPVPLHSRVRVTADSPDGDRLVCVGRLVTWDAVRFRVVDEKAGPVGIDRHSVDRFELYLGRDSHSIRGLLIGAAAGAAGGLAVGAVAAGDCMGESCWPYYGGPAIGLAVGSLVGVIVGSRTGPEAWEEVPWPPPDTDGAPAASSP